MGSYLDIMMFAGLRGYRNEPARVFVAGEIGFYDLPSTPTSPRNEIFLYIIASTLKTKGVCAPRVKCHNDCFYFILFLGSHQ